MRGDITPWGTVLDCVGDGMAEDYETHEPVAYVMASFRVAGEALAVRKRMRADTPVEITGFDRQLDR